MRPNRGQVPQNRPEWSKRAGNWRRIHCQFHHMNIQASTRDLAGVVQTILSIQSFLTWQSKLLMTYKHLSQAERYQIYALMKAGHDQSQIAILLDRHLIHHSRGKNCIHTPAALGLAANSFGLLHRANIRFMADRAASWINGIHLHFLDLHRS